MVCMNARLFVCPVLCLILLAGPGCASTQAIDPHASVRKPVAGTEFRAPYPVIQVPPVTSPAVALPQVPSPAALPPPVAVPRAAVITQCDPTGCWDSNGQRLNRVGPGLAGPGGSCTVQGNAALCP